MSKQIYYRIGGIEVQAYGLEEYKTMQVTKDKEYLATQESWFDEHVKTLPVVRSADPNSDAFIYPGTEEDWPWEE